MARTPLKVKVESHDSQIDSVLFQLSVSQALNVTPISDITVKLNQTITPIQVSVSGGSGNYKYSIFGAPDSVKISSLGRITGKPTQRGDFTILVRVRDTPSSDDGATGTAPPITGSVSFKMYVQGPLVLGSIPKVNATKGEEITAIQVSASGGGKPYKYFMSGAPSGIVISSSGGSNTSSTSSGPSGSAISSSEASITASITGTPTTTGTSTIKVKVCDANSKVDSILFTMTVYPPLTLGSISNVTETQNQAITAIQASASGGRGTYTYSMSGVPSGISISSSGRITGTPTTTGTSTIKVKVRDADSRRDSTSFTMKVYSPLTLGSISNVTATKNQAITAIQASASGGRTPYTYSISGAPSGITMSSSGRITGTPTTTGTSTIKVKVRDADSRRDSTSFTLSVSQVVTALTLSSISNVTATKSESITAIQASASGGRTPYTYSISGAPSGIAISSSGKITGTPTTTGKSTITVTVSDTDNRTASTSFTMTVSASLTVSSIADVTETHNTAITAIQVSASGGRTPYTYSMSGAPSGIAISSSGEITGKPKATGTSTITVTVRDADSRTASTSFTMTVNALPCDFNGDGVVDNADYLLFVAVYGKSSSDEGFDARMDLNNDGIVNIADFLIFVNHYGGGASGSELVLPF